MTRQSRQAVLSIGLLLVCFSTCLSTAALAQLPPPPPTTLWSFLGIPQGYRYVRDNAFNRNGNRPGMERKPPLKAIADPKKLESSGPSIRQAAEALRTSCQGNGDTMFMEAGPTPAPQTGGEQPTPAPEVGGERPSAAPPVLIDPTPPAAPLPNPPRPAPAPAPAPTNPPQAATPKPAPVAIDNKRTSRRTAMLKAQPVKSSKPADNTVVVKHPLPPVEDPTYDAPASTPPTATVRVTPHWTPAAVQQAVFVRDSFRGPFPIDDAVVNPSPESVMVASLPDRNQIVASEPTEIDETLGLAPIVSPDSVKRPSAKAKLIPASRPSSGDSPAVLPVSVQMPSSSKTTSSKSTATEPTHQAASLVMTSEVSLNQPAKLARPKAATPRQLPGAEFGAGTVSSVRLKDGMALIEFNTDASLPAGSLLRAYHQYALAAKKAVCDLQVIESENGKAVVVAHGSSQLSDLAVGDQAVVLQ